MLRSAQHSLKMTSLGDASLSTQDDGFWVGFAQDSPPLKLLLDRHPAPCKRARSGAPPKIFVSHYGRGGMLLTAQLVKSIPCAPPPHALLLRVRCTFTTPL